MLAGERSFAYNRLNQLTEIIATDHTAEHTFTTTTTYEYNADGERTREITAYFGGGQKVNDFVYGKTTGGDMTLTRGYDPKRDDTWFSQLNRALENGEECLYTVTQTPVTTTGTTYGKTTTWPNIPVKSLKHMDSTAGSEADAGMIEIVFATRGPGAS